MYLSKNACFVSAWWTTFVYIWQGKSIVLQSTLLLHVFSLFLIFSVKFLGTLIEIVVSCYIRLYYVISSPVYLNKLKIIVPFTNRTCRLVRLCSENKTWCNIPLKLTSLLQFLRFFVYFSLPMRWNWMCQVWRINCLATTEFVFNWKFLHFV